MHIKFEFFFFFRKEQCVSTQTEVYILREGKGKVRQNPGGPHVVHSL